MQDGKRLIFNEITPFHIIILHFSYVSVHKYVPWAQLSSAVKYSG